MMLRRIAFAVALPVALLADRGSRHRGELELDREGRLGRSGRDGQQVRCRHRQEGHGSADQARRDRHADPGRRLHDDREGREGLLRLRQRQRRHQGPPDQVHPLQRAAEPGAGGCAGAEADRERQGRRRRRQHQLRRVRRQLEVLQVQGLPRHRRRRPGRVLRHPADRRVEHGPPLQRHRCGSGTDPRRRQEDRDRLAGLDLGVRRRRSGQARRGEGRRRQGLPDAPARHGRLVPAAPDVPVRR